MFTNSYWFVEPDTIKKYEANISFSYLFLFKTIEKLSSIALTQLPYTKLQLLYTKL